MNALIILHPGFEEIEAITPADLLSRADIQPTLASIDTKVSVTGRSGITLQADCTLADCTSQEFDLVIVPGGPGIQQIRQHSALCERLHRQLNSGRHLACICAAPLLLKDAGLTTGRSITCHPSAAAELQTTNTSAVIVDGTLITSRGAGTATEFGLTLIEELKDAELANEIAASICWQPAS